MATTTETELQTDDSGVGAYRFPATEDTLSSGGEEEEDDAKEDDEEGEFEFCYKFRPLYAEDVNSQRADDEAGVPWLSGSGIFVRREPPRGPRGSKSDGFVDTLAKLRLGSPAPSSPLAYASSSSLEATKKGGEGEEGGTKAKKNERDEQSDVRKKKHKSHSERRPSANAEAGGGRDGYSQQLGIAGARVSIGAEDLGDLLITDEDHRQTVTITRAQWKRWQHQEAYLIALTHELERVRKQMHELELATTPRSASGGQEESEKDRKMREFKEMMAARYSTIRTDAQGYKEKVIVDYYANRLEQRQRNVRAKASGTPEETTPRAPSTAGKAKTKTKRRTTPPALGASGSSLLSRFKKNG